MSWTGGCQCGAVRFRVDMALHKPGVCHCRMCQKATGGLFGAYVTPEGLTWTRGEPKRFQSSNFIRRGFCPECGTQLTFEHKYGVDLTIGAFDDPAGIAPVFQIGVESKLPYTDTLAALPGRAPDEEARLAPYYARVVSYQHPDHDTDAWPPTAS